MNRVLPVLTSPTLINFCGYLTCFFYSLQTYTQHVPSNIFVVWQRSLTLARPSITHCHKWNSDMLNSPVSIETCRKIWRHTYKLVALFWQRFCEYCQTQHAHKYTESDNSTNPRVVTWLKSGIVIALSSDQNREISTCSTCFVIWFC